MWSISLQLQGDVVSVENSELTIASYAYDAWGNMTAISGTYAELNPLRYRGYVYDQELGLYYLGSRYYDPAVGRFINADSVNSTGQGLLGLNNYAYCGNNPTARRDPEGFVWETVFDVASLAGSIVEIAVNPGDPWAWAGAVGDALDLIPFVTGIGEVTRAVKTTAKFIDNTDDVVGVAKKLYRSANSASELKKSTGSYEILYKSGKNYVGKGGFDRAIKSAVRNTKRHPDDVVTAIRWKAAPNHRTAFIEEYALQSIRKVANGKTYNKIWSPGKKYYMYK